MSETYPAPAYEQEAISANERRIAEIKAHPSYEAVKAANPHREPSFLELGEHAADAAFTRLTKAQKLAGLLDPLIAEVQAQMRGGGPVTSSILAQLQAARAIVD